VGKTKVMSLAIVWSYFHALRESDSPMARHFVMIAPNLTVMRQAFLAGVADYRSMYTPKSWVAGWMVRVLAQVAFFAVIGERLGDDESVTFYLLVGNALAIAAITGVFSLNTTSSERWAGTLPLLVASPSSSTGALPPATC
jgi:ABC-2 type transport system permease protein